MDAFEIGERIRKERKRQKLTQVQLAELTGVGRTTVWQVEKGSYDDLGVRKLMRMLDVLGLCLEVASTPAPPTLDELLEENERHDASLGVKQKKWHA